MIYQISPTLVEQYRKCHEGEFGGDQTKLIEYLNSTFTGNDSTSLGDCYHWVIEHGDNAYELLPWEMKDQVRYYRIKDSDGKMTWNITKDAMKPAVALHDKHPNGVFEMWGSLQLNVDGHAVKTVFRTDMIDGLEIHEFKTTRGQEPKIEDYENSLQWRMYMMAYPEAQKVIYHVFHLKTNEMDILEAKEFTFEFLREEDNEVLVKESMRGLIRFCQMHGLEARITPRDKK